MYCFYYQVFLKLNLVTSLPSQSDSTSERLLDTGKPKERSYVPFVRESPIITKLKFDSHNWILYVLEFGSKGLGSRIDTSSLLEYIRYFI